MTPDDKTRMLAKRLGWESPFRAEEDGPEARVVDDAGQHVCTCSDDDEAAVIVEALNKLWEALGL